jgi:hypothetical protein
MIKWKALGFCASSKCPSYASNPNKWYFWNRKKWSWVIRSLAFARAHQISLCLSSIYFMMYPNCNWVHIIFFNLWDTCGTYVDIHDVDLGSHAPWIGFPLVQFWSDSKKWFPPYLVVWWKNLLMKKWAKQPRLINPM